MTSIELNRGSDLHAVMTLRDGGQAVDLTGLVPEIVEVVPAGLAASMQFTIPDATGGQMLLASPWSDSWPRGVGALVQIRLRLEGLHDAFPVIQVVLK